MNKWMNEIPALALWGRVPYLSVTEAPHDTESSVLKQTPWIRYECSIKRDEGA